MARNIVITIDGPAGSGKSTVARKVAKKLGFIHLNSGALFRAVAHLADGEEIDFSDDQRLSQFASDRLFEFVIDESGNTRFRVDGRYLESELRTEDVGRTASKIAALAGLRDCLKRVQQEIALRSSVVVEGRDAGTHVFPDAIAKFFLDASLDVRAERRFNELKSSGATSVSLEEIQGDIAKRDLRDQTREVAPHKKADDARLIDTSSLSADEVVDEVCRIVSELT